jgi:hypothetical protein
MRHGRKKERENKKRTDAIIVKTKGMEKEWNLWKNKGSNRPQRCTNAPTNGQVLQRMAREHL